MIRKLFIRLDRAISVLIWGTPYTISAIAGRKALAGNRAAIAFCWVLDLVDKGHCLDAYMTDRGLK